MEAYKREFIEFMVDSQVLKFGDFTLKSGRKSPFFMKKYPSSMHISAEGTVASLLSDTFNMLTGSSA